MNEEKYIDELIDSIKVLFVANRGEFYPNKDFGSLIRKNKKMPKDEYALAYARQAVDGVDGVFVKGVKSIEDKYIFDVIVNGYERQVEIKNDNIV